MRFMNLLKSIWSWFQWVRSFRLKSQHEADLDNWDGSTPSPNNLKPAGDLLHVASDTGNEDQCS